jgi:predicted AlkP superfamily phosphohydrolase/phosphomutase
MPTDLARGERVLPLLVIGISGATWSVITPLLSEGGLANIRTLMRHGSWGVLESVKTRNDKHYRPQTAWPSVFSGRLPEGHGITEYFHTSRDLRCRSLWDFFNEKGLAVGLYRTPILWPPPRIDGFVVPSLYARDGRAWPEELSFIAGYYRRQQDTKLRPDTWSILRRSLKFVPLVFGPGQDWRLPFGLLRAAARLATVRDRETRALILRHAKLDFSTAMFLRLWRRFDPRLAIFNSFEVDTISHRFWRYHEPEKFEQPPSAPAPALRRAVKDAYAHLDRVIGVLLERLPPDGVVAVVSEHGMAAESPSGEVGRWRYMIDAERLKAIARLDAGIVGVPIARWVVFRREDQGPLDHGIGDKLRSLVVAETGLPLFRTHHHGEDEIIVKLDLDRAHYGSLQDIGTLHVKTPTADIVPIGDLLQRAGPTRSAMHRKEGVILVKGPGIRSDFQVHGAVVTDVMPTLLRACGLAVPPDLDGRVLDLFA